ncbi:Raffinose synthase [Penicillium riverlandense]|uniref:Raffinose synthase n=1 Tax=Penicillium riverlandense TaxID=1903569 RepID=UPI0025497B0A|nr:Raffinose synthase [Penicillium riverlandense]KAJ5812070.1 Raffinose synthase [Penicillium riverlandense]
MQVNTRDTSTLPIRGPADRQKPSQALFLRPAQMSLFARVTCYPPLGQSTCVQRVQKALRSEEDDSLHFTVVIESSIAFPAQSWEAQIWHNITSTEWTALPLKKRDPSSAPLLTGNEAEYGYHRYVFSDEIKLPAAGGHAQFTVRFRTNPDTEWQWANQQRPVSDGEVVFTPRNLQLVQGSSTESATTPNAKEELGKYIDSLSSNVQVESRASEAPGSTLWSVSGDADQAREGTSGVKLVPLGTPSSLLKYFALVRIWSPWLGPRHGKDKFRLTEDALLCSFLRKDGFHLVLLAVSGVNDVLTVLQSSDNGEIMIKARSENTGTSQFQVLVAVAENFEVAMSAVMYEARKVVKPFTEAANLSPAAGEESSPISAPGDDDMVVVEKDPKMQWLTEWFDGLTYCTWNGLGQNLTEEKILHALEALKAQGIKVVNLIIDDNWQTVDNEGESQFKRRWQQFEANPKGFPRGLKETVEAIRRNNPSIEHIAVWHSLLGYWGGISPDGDLAQRYKTKEVKVKDPAAGGPIAHNITDGKILAIDPDDVQQFYNEFYSYLTSVGVDSVKTDSQFFLDLLEDPEDRKRFMTSYQDAWSISALKHFDTRSISCMSLIPQIIFHSQLPNNKPAIPIRNSDDFFPEVPASHPWHLFCNAHNSLLTRYLNALPDWDMFQTSHPYASFHAAARCVSGGPVYITDEPGKHDLNILNQMTAPTVQGNSVILRPSVVGRTIDIYHDYNEGHVLRVGCYTGWAKTGSGILGLFNIQSAEASCMVSLMDFPGIHEDADGQYVVRAHNSGKMTSRMRPLARDSLVSVVLSHKGWEILTAYPTRSFTLRGSHGCNAPGSSLTHVAVLGLLGKMTGAAALVTSDISVVENGRLRFDITLKALGTLGIYFSDLQDRSIAHNFMVMISGQAVPRKTVWKEGGEDANVLAIDVLAAWKALHLDSGWSNEVVVQAFVG